VILELRENRLIGRACPPPNRNPRGIRHEKVFGLGLEPFNLALLEKLGEDRAIEFLEALSAEESVGIQEPFKLMDLVQLAEKRMNEHGPVDAVLNY